MDEKTCGLFSLESPGWFMQPPKKLSKRGYFELALFIRSQLEKVGFNSRIVTGLSKQAMSCYVYSERDGLEIKTRVSGHPQSRRHKKIDTVASYAQARIRIKWIQVNFPQKRSQADIHVALRHPNSEQIHGTQSNTPSGL